VPLAKDNLEAIMEEKNRISKSLKELLPFDGKENLDGNW